MYEHYFRLTRPPFSLALEPDLLLLTGAHREAMAALTYAITSQKGFVVLTGEIGTGKSTVIRSVLRTLIASYGDRFRFCLVVNPNLSADDLLDFVLSGLGARDLPAAKSQRLIRFQQLLVQGRKAGQICAIIIDEAHRLSPEVLEEVRLWTNFETSECKLLQIVLAGQPELDETLGQPQLRQLKQRIAFRTTLAALAPEDVRTYIEHRWSRAGGEIPTPFTARAVEAVTFWSGGVPRLINAICDNALLTSFAEEIRVVTAREVNEAAADLNLRASGTPPLEQEDAVSGAGAGKIPDEAVPDPDEPAMAAAVAGTGHPPMFGAVDTDGVLKRWAVRFGLGKSTK
jgi:general secretion pathway protein A